VKIVAARAALLTIGILHAPPALAQAPDLLFLNGTIVTVDKQSSVRQAMAIRGDRIVALGSSADIRAMYFGGGSTCPSGPWRVDRSKTRLENNLHAFSSLARTR
jgi:hypothetical protein